MQSYFSLALYGSPKGRDHIVLNSCNILDTAFDLLWSSVFDAKIWKFVDLNVQKGF